MKIAVISDTHDNIANLKKIIGWLNQKKIKTLLHCGDVCAPVTLREIIDNFKGKIHLVFGNVDGDQFKMGEIALGKKVKIYGELGKIKIGGKKIAFCHLPDFAKGLASSGEYDIVFYGHSHKPWEEKIGQCRLVNPGNAANFLFKASFAVYDTKTDKLELKILEKMDL